MATRSRLVACGLSLVASLPAADAQAHDRPASRRVLVSAEGSLLTLMVVMDEPDGPAAAALAAGWRLDGDAASLSPAERLAQAQLLLPRLRHGWSLEVEQRPVAGTLTDFVVTPHKGGRPDAGFVAAATWTTPLPTGPVDVALYAAKAEVGVEAEVQVVAPWQVGNTALPRDPSGWLVGPFALDVNRPAWVELVKAEAAPSPPPAVPPAPKSPAATRSKP